MNNKIERYMKKADIDKVILIANVYAKTTYYNLDKERLRIEFFNEKELDQILTSLKREGYKVYCYFDEHAFIDAVLTSKIVITSKTLVFNLARNGNGVSKKALIPTFCDLMNIKYTGSNGYTCSLSRNKFHVAKLLQQHNLHGLKTYQYDKDGWLLDERPPNNLRVIMKPLYESASRGVSNSNIVNSSDIDFYFKIKNYYRTLQAPIVAQEFINGYEVKVPVFELDKVTALKPVAISMDNSSLLDDKIITEELSYHYQYSNCNCDSFLTLAQQHEIQVCAEKIFKLLGMQNYARIDCRVTTKGEFYFYDFATMPYFTAHSEMNFAMETISQSQSTLFNLIFNSALEQKYLQHIEI